MIGNVELRKFQNIHIKIIQKQLQMSMIEKYLKKHINIQIKDKKVLIIFVLIYTTILMKYQKMINLFDQPTNYRAQSCVAIT